MVIPSHPRSKQLLMVTSRIMRRYLINKRFDDPPENLNANRGHRLTIRKEQRRMIAYQHHGFRSKSICQADAEKIGRAHV